MELPVSDTARDHVDATWGHLPPDAKRLVARIMTTIETITARFMERINPPTIANQTATMLIERRPPYPREISEMRRDYLREVEPWNRAIVSIVSRYPKPIWVMTGLPLIITKDAVTTPKL